ncbi:hypothetical protein [Curtobacterium sp. C2H10]|uniref:hypothetical protein n=1 Tax=Curtobacterium sp. C2H10 TaxID=2736664 RepID=UPI0021BFED45|nr:hypothetical protein [Curtobacterium sp. C2H10]MCT9620872.1 hypothetical protein [Curtobacterium sp. C2H10]
MIPIWLPWRENASANNQDQETTMDDQIEVISDGNGLAALGEPATDEYGLSGVREVGVVRITGHDVRIRPRTPVQRLRVTLGHLRAGSAIWEDADFSFIALGSLRQEA